MLFNASDWRTYAMAVAVVCSARLDSNAKIIEVPLAHLLCDVCSECVRVFFRRFLVSSVRLRYANLLCRLMGDVY